MKPIPQIQPPLFIKPKLPNVQSSTHKKSRNHSLKKIPYYHQNNTNNQSHSLYSLGLFPKIQQKFKKHQIINKNNGQTSLQKNAAKWYLPNGHLKKRQKLLTQANNVSQQFILCDQSFISLTNKLMATQGDIKDTMIDFKKKIQMNKLFIKKEIERKNKQNQSTIIKKDLNEWGRKNRAVSSRVVQLNDDGYSGESSFNNNSRGNNNNINVIVNCNINKDWQSQMNKNNNTKKRTIQTPKSKLQSSLIKHTNNKANNSSSKKKKRMSSNNHNNTNLLIESNQRRRQKTQILQPSSTSSGVIINSNINNRRQVGNIDQRQKNQQKSLRSMSKRKSEGLFGELQGMLDQKIRDNNYHDNHNKNDRLSEKDDINGRRQLQYHQEESKLRELLNKLYKHKSNTNNNSDSNNNNHNIQNNNQQHYLSINKNNNNIIITQPFHKHYHHHSASGQLLVLQQSTDNLAQSSMTSCEKIKNNQQITYNQWNRLQLESTSQITYRKSSFQQQLNKLSQYAQRNDASLQKYIGMRKELMKLGFQVNANHNNNKNIQNNNNNNQNNNKNNNNKNNQNNNKNNHNNKKYNNNKNQTINVNNIKKNPTKDNR